METVEKVNKERCAVRLSLDSLFIRPRVLRPFPGYVLTSVFCQNVKMLFHKVSFFKEIFHQNVVSHGVILQAKFIPRDNKKYRLTSDKLQYASLYLYLYERRYLSKTY